MITRNAKPTKPAKTIKVKRPFYFELLAENERLKQEVEWHKELLSDLTERSNMPEPLIENVKKRMRLVESPVSNS